MLSISSVNMYMKASQSRSVAERFVCGKVGQECKMLWNRAVNWISGLLPDCPMNLPA